MLSEGHDDDSLGKILGVSRTAVSRWRRDKRRPSGMNMVRVRLLSDGKVSLEDFMTDDLDEGGTLSTTKRGSSGPDTAEPSKCVAALEG